MKRQRFNNYYDENSRHTRVKMYKSGKNWVRTIMSRVGLIHIKDKDEPVKVRCNDKLEPKYFKTATLIKGVASVGAVLGGGALLTEQVQAEETTVSSEVATETLATTEVVSLTTGI
ncbi:MAG: KxYKxGKxW signal peptide domain-containing protein, partial [Streptococcus sp.]|nr:KxYKxGKxW signal peptide domain-containing protein [Streptococcus sp.]